MKLGSRKEGFQRDIAIANKYFQGNKKYRKKVIGNGLVRGNGDSIWLKRRKTLPLIIENLLEKKLIFLFAFHDK